MNHNKSKRFYIISITLSPIVLFIFFLLLSIPVVITGCTKDEISVPEFTPPATPPQEVKIEHLLLDYMEDEVAADAKYKGKRIWLNDIEVEDVVTKFFAVRREGFGNTNLYVEYFLSLGCKFTLKDFELMQNVQVGYILNLVGNCDGLFDGLIVINDCWAESVFGDLNTPVEGIY